MRKGKKLSVLGAALAMTVLILDGKTALTGAAEGIELCTKVVIPSLFPFFVLSVYLMGILEGTNLPVLVLLGRWSGFSKGIEKLMIPAFLGGYPVGAKCVTEAWKAGVLDRDNAQKMLSFCSNAGPAFIFGMVASIFSEIWMVWALWAIHILSACLVARCIPTDSKSLFVGESKEISFSSALASSVTVMMQVCGWVILFRILMGFLDRWFLWMLSPVTRAWIVGILELSNGCCELAAVENEKLRFMICAGMLAWGGICVSMQTASVTGGLSLAYYVTGKSLQTVFSLLIAAGTIYGTHWILLLAAMILIFLPGNRRNNSSNLGLIGV